MKKSGFQKGVKFSESHKQKLRLAKLGKSGDQTNHWKGDDVGYHGVHIWVRKHLGKPSHCACCGTTRKTRYHWANISRSYKRDFSDWIRLCPSCHRLYDLGKITLPVIKE